MLGKRFSFELIAQDDKARLGKIYTSKGILILLHLCQLEHKEQ